MEKMCTSKTFSKMAKGRMHTRGVHIWVILEKLMWWWFFPWFGSKKQLLQTNFFKIPTLCFRARALKISY